MTKSEFDKKFALVEQSLLNIAGVLGHVHLNMIKRQISTFKKSNISTIIDNDVTKNNNDSINKILEMFLDEQKSTLESFANQTRNLVENTKEIKTEILSRLQEHKELNVGIRNVVFEVKTLWKDELSKEKDPFKKVLSLDEDICYVEWTLGTPANWDIDDIKETLERFSSLIGKYFRIVFIYKGSLVIQTSAQLRFLQSDVEFQLAVKWFLKDFLDICNIDTDTKTIVQVTISVSNEKFESRYSDSQTMDTSWLTCDLCSRKNDSSNAIQFCSECQYKLCRQCLSNHNSNAAFFEHPLTNISALSFENFCVKHDGSIFDFFCVVHDCLCCLSCKTEEHNSCQDVLPLEDAAKDVKHSDMFQEFSDSVLNFTMTVNRAIASQDINIVNLDNDESTFSIKLKSNTAKIKTRLDELIRMVTLETRALRNEHIARTESDRNSLLQIKRLIRNMSRKIDQESKNDSQKQMFVLLNSFKLEILGLDNKLQNILPTLMTRRIIFQPQEGIDIALTTLGATRVDTFKCVEDYKLHKTQQLQVPSFTHQKPSKFRFERKIEIKRSDDSIIRKMCITDDCRLLLCTFNGNNLLSYSDSGDYLQECQLSSTAWDIVVIPGEDKAVVTLPVQSSIQIIDIKTFSAGSIYPVPFACWGITIVNGKICVNGHQIVYILDKQGKQLKKVRVPNDRHITNLHSGPMESIYYTDRTCDAVCHFTLEGEELFRYTSVDLKGPNEVATDNSVFLYVACEKSNNIQRIAPNGEFQDIILNTENDINCPTDILFSNDHRKLFVLNHVEDNIYVIVFSCS